MHRLDGRRHRDHFLDQTGLEHRGNARGAGSGQKQRVPSRREIKVALQHAQELKHLLGLARVVTLVGLRDPRAEVVAEHVLAGGAADVDGAGEGVGVHRAPILAATSAT